MHLGSCVGEMAVLNRKSSMLREGGVKKGHKPPINAVSGLLVAARPMCDLH